MIGIIGHGLIATAISQQCNGALYGRLDAFDQKHYDIIIVAAPTGNRLRVSKDPTADRLDCENILEKINSAFESNKNKTPLLPLGVSNKELDF